MNLTFMCGGEEKFGAQIPYVLSYNVSLPIANIKLTQLSKSGGPLLLQCRLVKRSETTAARKIVLRHIRYLAVEKRGQGIVNFGFNPGFIS